MESFFLSVKEIIGSLNFKEIFSTFMVLFAVIDITGGTPVILDLKLSGKKIEAGKAALISTVIFLAFLFLGNAILGLFNVDIKSFAVAGSIILLILAFEMVLDVEIFKYAGPSANATIVPIVFPLVAGAGALTTTISLRAEYATINIIIAILLNMLIVYVVLKKVDIAEKILGKGGVYILRKFFGVILIAISIKLFLSNVVTLF